MRIRPGPDEEHKEAERTRTEVRQGRARGCNIHVLIRGVGGMTAAFLLRLHAHSR